MTSTRLGATKVRLAGPADAALLVRMVTAFHAHEGIALAEATRAAALSRLLADPTLGRILVAEKAGAVVGYTILCLGYSVEFGGRDAFIDEAWVEPSARGAGVGNALLASAEQEARSAGVLALHLEADHNNPRGAALYRRLGFKDHERHLMTRRLT